jgi:hypothetical protein
MDVHRLVFIDLVDGHQRRPRCAYYRHSDYLRLPALVIVSTLKSRLGFT